jgi:DNA-binding transcriptional LysR family regulator
MNFTLHQLRVFMMIVEKQSITKAAEELNMTQPAVSIQLRNLQDQFDIALTELIGRKVYITDFGMELYRIALRVMGEVDTINYQTLHFKGFLSGKLRISMVSTGKYIMPYYLRDFLKAHPHIDFEMDVTNKRKVIASLEQNEVDFSLVSVLPNDLQVQEELLMPNKLFLFGPAKNDFSIKGKLDASVFKELPLIFREEGSGTRHTMQQYFHKAHIRPKVSLALTSTEAVKQAVIAGLGYSVLSILSLKNELKLKEVKVIPVKGFPLNAHWRLIWLQKKQLTAVAAAFLQYVQANKTAIYQKHFAWTENY